jgi:hypothetical protein
MNDDILNQGCIYKFLSNFDFLPLFLRLIGLIWEGLFLLCLCTGAGKWRWCSGGLPMPAVPMARHPGAPVLPPDLKMKNQNPK